ncbi:hypothetical protein Micbo1qcDRAFT_175640 [Microdochium bolleyi]|uniref:Integral membrane protein n=1 Tax=Microdochium bolleyi TaxID=196109 RepID=A0A136J2H2_9PEZI|nr:hypothetical protein Micbo1qcDRAFT_175640 [Microdochium bolleyi]
MALPVTTIMPFGSLPSCAAVCGPLYDANGGCVPPAAPTAQPSVYESCFCGNKALQPFSASPSGVCDAACSNPQDLASIQGWYKSFCAGKAAAPTGTNSGSVPTSSSTSTPVKNGDGGSWISSHWQWVVFIVVVIVAIIAIWTGACIWRRKYLKKKDRMYELGKGLPSSVAVNHQGDLVGPGARDSTYSGQGPLMAGATAPVEKERRKWNPTQRT